MKVLILFYSPDKVRNFSQIIIDWIFFVQMSGVAFHNNWLICSISSNTFIKAVFFIIFFSSTRGYYPKGGGEIHVTVKPVKQLRPLQLLERGSLTRITGRAFVAGRLPFRVSYSLIVYITDIIKPRFSNVCEAVPMSLFWAPQIQWITGSAFRISFYLDWHVDSGFFNKLILVRT